MQTYLIDFNSEFNKKLLQLFILLNDEKEITYESFNDYVRTERPFFSKLIKEYHNMLIKLKLKYTLIKEKIQDKDNESYYSYNAYYQTQVIEDYSFSINELTDEEKIRYIYVIFYLMLRNEICVTPKKFKQFLNIDINRTSFKRFIDNFKDLVGFDIYKNELQSYILDND